MSTSGTYNYHPKVAHASAIFPQMASDTVQPAFFFGGSQVPINLGIRTGSGFRTPYLSHRREQAGLEASGRGIKTTMQKHHKIYLPKYMKSI
jgi:hypothetical protein